MNTICLYLENQENRTILTEMLQDTFLIIESSDKFPDEPFDLCITDGIILDRNVKFFCAQKQSAPPLSLPILLLAACYSPELFTQDWWEVVDEVVLFPTRKQILLKRIQTLLRSRINSLTLQEEKKALIEANTRISLGMKAGGISYWEVVLATGEILLSDEWEEQLGCPVNYDNAQEELFRHIHPEDAEPFRNDLQQIIRDRTGTLSVIYRMSCDGSNYSWYILKSTFVKDPLGNPVRLLISQINITEQKKMELRHLEHEKEIAEAENRLQKHRMFTEAIMKSSQVGIIFLNKEGCVIDVNSAMTEMIGLPESEIVGKKEQPDLWKIMEPLEHSIPSCSSMPVYRSIREKKVIPPEEYQFRKDGILKTYTISAAPVFENDHEVTGGISVWQDITERKIVEDQLRMSNNRYNTLFQSINEGYCVIQVLFDENYRPVDLRFLEANASFSRQTGLENVIGKTVRDLIQNLEEYWLETIGKVALTGESMHFQRRSKQLQRWFDAYAYRFGNPEDFQVAVLFKDFTKQKQAAEELRQAHELIKNITMGTDDMIAALDKNFIFIFFNEAFYRVFKKLWSWELEIGTNMVEALSPWPVQQQKIIELWTRAFNGETFRETGELGPTESSKRFFEMQFSPLRDETGNITGAAHIMRDITESIHAQNELRKSQERLVGVLESMPDAFVSFDADLKFTYINRLAELLHQKKRNELIGKNIRDAFNDEESEIKIGMFEKVLVRHEPETFTLYNSGNYEWYEFRSFPNPDGISVFIKNVSDQKRAETALKESETRFRALADNISQFAWMAKPDGRIFWYNKRWYDYTGTDREQMERLGWKKVLHPEHVERVESRMQHSWDTRELWEDTFPLRKYDGTYRWFLSRALPIRNEKGEIQLWFGTNTDITELRDTEEKLKQYTEELATANSDLESFTYSVSHDLRTPLVTIHKFTQFFMEDFAEQIEEEGLEYLRRIDAGIDKMQALIDDMLTLSRISRHEMNRQNVDLSTLVRNYLQELKDSEPDRQVEFIVQDDVHLSADPRLIHLALENLLRNAWKFTGKNSLTRVQFAAVSRYNKTICFIRDNGIGFDMQFAKKIFEPFKRVHAEKEYGGTGVGLSIVQRVIGRHGGEIWAESEAGKGATFYFTLH